MARDRRVSEWQKSQPRNCPLCRCADLDLGDLLGMLYFAATGRYEAWNGDFGVIVDANYVGIEQETYMLGPLGADLQGGVRYNSIRQEIDVATPGPGNPLVLGGDQNWIEPVIGARGMWRLNKQWTGIASL
ncbi:hypothetical protein [Ruegeria atlantica]|uniref:hypothetical protein n=1 Tax=Ruegeria atlantica TaxID=81569 RepID=UPI0024949C3E|nr:hypothetical protein [Ruegeria atlantica]